MNFTNYELLIWTLLAGTTVENKGKLILTEIFPSVKNMIFFSIH